MVCSICKKGGHTKSNCPNDPSRGSSISASFFVLLAALFGFLAFLVWNIGVINQFNLGAPTYVVYVIAAGLAAILLFGVLHSSGQFKGVFPGFCIELGGSAALFFVVLLAGLEFEKSQKSGEFTFTLYLHPAGKNQEFLKVKGEVTLLTNNSPKATFNDGKAKFEDLPKALKGHEVKYTIEVEGYELTAGNPNALSLKPNSSFSLFLQPKVAPKEVVQVPVQEKSKDPLALTLGAAMKLITQLKSPEERVTKAADTLQQFKDVISSSEDLEVAARAAAMHGLLAYEYGVMNNASKECTELDRQFANLKSIYDKDPSWTPPTLFPSPPAALEIANNRVNFAFAAIAENNADNENATRVRIAKELDFARGALSKSRAPVTDNAKAWLSICTAHMANGDFLAAKVDLSEALRLTGEPAKPTEERMEDKEFYFEYYSLAAVVNAECHEIHEAERNLNRAISHRIEGDPNAHGKIGFVFLQIARATASKEEAKKYLEAANDEFRLSDGCPSCRFNFACARSKLAEIMGKENGEDVISESRNDLAYAIKMLEECPMQPDIEAISKDPYLSFANESEEIRNALTAFQWKNSPHPSKRPPPASVWKSTLWHFGIPLKRLKFSVLSVPGNELAEMKVFPFLLVTMGFGWQIQ